MNPTSIIHDDPNVSIDPFDSTATALGLATERNNNNPNKWKFVRRSTLSPSTRAPEVEPVYTNNEKYVPIKTERTHDHLLITPALSSLQHTHGESESFHNDADNQNEHINEGFLYDYDSEVGMSGYYDNQPPEDDDALPPGFIVPVLPIVVPDRLRQMYQNRIDECNAERAKEAAEAAAKNKHYKHTQKDIKSSENQAYQSFKDPGLNLDEYNVFREDGVSQQKDGNHKEAIHSSRTNRALVDAFHKDSIDTSLPYDADTNRRSIIQKRNSDQGEAESSNDAKCFAHSNHQYDTRFEYSDVQKKRDFIKKYNGSANVYNLAAPNNATKRRPSNTPLDAHEVTDKLQKTDNPLFAANTPPLVLNVTPELIERDRELERRAREAMMRTSAVLSEEQWEDPMLVAEYSGEIFCHLYDIERTMMADPGYANNQQHEINWNMRGLLIDWIIEVHYLFGLLPETLFLTVNIIDRFLSMRTVALGKLQLVGITCLFIATKFEEIICPNMLDFLYMTDDAVTEDDLIKAERFILQNLDFRLCYANPLGFLRRICVEEMECDIHTRTLSKYFMEAALIDHRFIGIRPSQIAASSLWLSRRMLAKGKWTNKFTAHTGYCAAQVKPVVTMLLDFLAQPITHDTFFRKWSSKQYSKASIFVRDWVNRYYLNK